MNLAKLLLASAFVCSYNPVAAKQSKAGKKATENFDCRFANPAILQGKDGYEETKDTNLTLADFIEHALKLNSLYVNAVNAYSKGGNPQSIYDVGKNAMLASKSAHAPFFGANPQLVKLMFCQGVGDIVEQMEATCDYENLEATYANSAALFMQGFYAQYVLDGSSILDCKLESEEGEPEMTFEGKFGHLLSKETKEFLED